MHSSELFSIINRRRADMVVKHEGVGIAVASFDDGLVVHQAVVR
jgi:butyrate kinase